MHVPDHRAQLPAEHGKPCRCQGRRAGDSPRRRRRRPTRGHGLDRLARRAARVDWRFTADARRHRRRSPRTATSAQDERRDGGRASRCCRSACRREAGTSGSHRRHGEHARLADDAGGVEPGRAVDRVSLAPSLAGSMLGALDFLTSYPYGCTEQTLSSFLPQPAR